MENHVKLSVGLNFSECTPIKGTFKGFATHKLSVSVAIGYENGSHFEEINDVTKMAKCSLKEQPSKKAMLQGKTTSG
jgi:hypothetical protein